MAKALLIDDEVLVREDLRRLLTAHPDIAIVGEAGTVTAARKLLAAPGYDLVFLDIQLIGGTGFDLVPLVSPAARIIFVTAYDQHAIRAFEVNALDYLLKPVAPARLARALARFKQPGHASATDLPLTKSDRLLLKLGTHHERFVHLDEIRLVSACENYSEVTLSRDERLLVRKTMKAWEVRLPADHFVRVHRQAIVNISHVTRIDRESDASWLLHLDGVARPVPVSTRQLHEVRERLSGHAL